MASDRTAAATTADPPDAVPGSSAGPKLLRNRSFQALWSSEAFAGVGEHAAGVAYPLLILATTGSAAAAGLVGSAQLLAQGLMSFWGGILADRMDRKQLLIGCSLLRAALLGVFTLMVLGGTVDVGVTLGIAIVSAACFGLSMPAGMAMIKQLVRPDQLAQATAQNQIRWFGAVTAGPSIGGALYGLSRVLPFIGASISFAVSTVLMLFVRKTPRPPAVPSGKKEILGGFRYLAKHPVLGPLIVSVTLSNLAFNTTGISLAVIATGTERGASESFIGLTLAIAGSGGLAGALMAQFVIRRVRPSAVFIVGYWIGPVAAVLLATVPGVVPLGIVVACVYIRGPIINALFLTYTAKVVPDELQGRVLGAIVFSSTIVSPLGVLAIGAVFEAAGPVWVFVAIGAIATLGALPTLTKGIRSLASAQDLT
ncbi:MFS transporter [Streptomyces albidoflavus]|uniref:MFS transporter n=1 Tax=Streptomyces albidoflavus TaxID=1886 RepID=UPI0033CD899F